MLAMGASSQIIKDCAAMSRSRMSQRRGLSRKRF